MRERPLLMGVVNITPDSFSDGGSFLKAEKALKHCHRLLDEGADLLDIGAESTRPGSDPVSEEEEWRRLEPVLAGLDLKRIRVSLDCSKPALQERALQMGVSMINDVGGGHPKLFEWAEKAGASVCVMHASAPPKVMQQHTDYVDLFEDIQQFFDQRRQMRGQRNVPLILDPGIGFGKTLEQNLSLMRGCRRFLQKGEQLLMGVSRKSWIPALLGPQATEIANRVIPSVVAQLHLASLGVDILRVHDVDQMQQALAVAEALSHSEAGSREAVLELFGLELSTVIGVLDEEKHHPQTLVLDVRALLHQRAWQTDSLKDSEDYVEVIQHVRGFAAEHAYQTLEAFLAGLYHHLMNVFDFQGLHLNLQKPRYAKPLGLSSIRMSYGDSF